MHGTYLDTHRWWENYFHCFLSFVWAFSKRQAFLVVSANIIGICPFLLLVFFKVEQIETRGRPLFYVFLPSVISGPVALIFSGFLFVRFLRFFLWSVKTSSLAKYDYVDYCEIFMLLVGKKKLWKQRGIWVWIRAFAHTRARSLM